MAPTKSNEKNPCCLNLCNSFWFVFFCTLTWIFRCLWCLFGQYDTFWKWWRGWALEPPYVTGWDRLIGPGVGGDAVYGQVLERKTEIDYDKFMNDREDDGVDFN